MATYGPMSQRAFFLTLLFTAAAAAAACKPQDGEAWAYLSGESSSSGIPGYDASAPISSSADASFESTSSSSSSGACGCEAEADASAPPGAFPTTPAPLPPLPETAGFNAIYSAADRMIYLPLFSTPSCGVVPPYGEAYYAAFTPTCTNPSGVFPSCFGDHASDAVCYTPGRIVTVAERDDEAISGGELVLSPFDLLGIATGAMDTKEGRIALAVKYCP